MSLLLSFVKAIEEANNFVNGIVWGPPILILILGAGFIVSFVTGFVVYRKFGFILKNTFGKMFDKAVADETGVTPFQAVSTALAATVGTGNIAGVATAIVSGGPGAVFWMWLAAIIGMTTKFSEVTLAVAYREKNVKGEYSGGPMYYIQNGLGLKWLAKLFAFFGAFAAFGIGCMTQSNSIAGAFKETFGLQPWIMGVILAVLAAIILIGGIKRIGQFAEKIVPFMAALYILGSLFILITHAGQIPGAFAKIFENAFTVKAAAGGAFGYTMMMAMRFGIARGVFTNEAGLGSAPIAHASAVTDHPVRQGMWGAFEVFVDTIMICSMTALIILISDINPHTSGLKGAALTSAAFKAGFSGGNYIVTVGILLFAFTTIVGWCYYGEKCMEYLFGTGTILPYRVVYVILVFVGTVTSLDLVWGISDTFNGLMAIPNLIAVIGLAGVIHNLVQDFFKDPERVRVSTEEFHDILKWKGPGKPL